MLIGGELVAGDGPPLEVENPFTEETIASVGTPSEEQLGRGPRRRRRGGSRMGAGTRGRPRRASPRGRDPAPSPNGRARRGDDDGGRQAAGRELGRGRVDGRLLGLLRRDRTGLGRPGDPFDRVEPALLGAEGATRGDRLHRPLELPAAPARVEDGAGARRRQRRGLQALRADAALHPDARALSRPPPLGSCQPDRGGRRGWGGDRLRSPSGRRCVHRIRRDRQEGGAGLRRPGRANQPRDGRQGPVHRLLRRGRPDRGRGQGWRLGRLPQLRPGLHVGRALLRDGGGLRRVPGRLRRLHPGPRDRRPDGERRPTSARWSPPASARR